MHRCAEPWLTAWVGATAASIFSNARASPIGLRVSSAPDASARYSRPRDTIMASSWAISGASTMAASHRMKKRRPMTPPPRLLSSPPRRRDLPPHHMPRRAQSDSSATAPTSAATMVITRTSRFLMWLISCATTPCSSSRSSASSRPRVTAIEACPGPRPVANALGSGSATIYTAGRGSPAAIAISSTTLSSWRSLSLSASFAVAATRAIGFAPVARSTARSPLKYPANADTEPTPSASTDPTGTAPPAWPR